jgi:hypothetical protein
MTDPTPPRYRAFISYSQRDQRLAKRLHAALESYRVPKGIEAALGPNRRLGRFFRDNDEMGASTDLGATIRRALEESENLIVVCSPNAARSRWVNAEVLHFQALGLGHRVFAVIVDGTPNSGDPETECFPPALRFEAVGDEPLSEGRAEPLGVDVRKEHFARARLRLAAGLMGISFDSLWQREKRRAAKRRVIAGVATLVLASVIVVLGSQWLTERNRARAQTIDRAMVGIRDDLASERATDGLGELSELYAGGARGIVEDALMGALSWASTPTELLKEIEPPALLANGAGLFFLPGNRSPHPITILDPSRHIVSSDRRWVLILGANEAIVLDSSDGREVARTGGLGQTDWSGRAFETGGGLMVVGGSYAGGVSNGTLATSVLVFSPRRSTLSVFRERTPIGNGMIDRWALSGDCRSLAMFSENDPADLLLFSEDADSLKRMTVPASISGWATMVVMPTDQSEGPLSEIGCTAPAADSGDPTGYTAETMSVRPIGLGAFWESENRWTAVDRASGSTRPGTPFCTEERPCPVRDFEFGTSFEGFDPGRPGWTAPTPPRGVHRDDPSFDSVDEQPVHTYHSQENGGYISAWCRNFEATPTCLEMATSVELQEERTEVELRSASGRWIFYPRGGVRGFRLYDLLTMRDVTPKGPELVGSTRWADFGPKDDRLFLALDGRLLVFAPPSDGGSWRPVDSGRSAQIPALSGRAGDGVAGLFALGDSSMIVVRTSGVVSRFDWRTGQQSWGRKISGIGEATGAVVSRNRRFLLIFGPGGGRLLDTTDGLVLSGVLLPPPAMKESTALPGCFPGAFVSDTGGVEMSCGQRAYRRERKPFRGNAESRVREILSDELLVASK